MPTPNLPDIVEQARRMTERPASNKKLKPSSYDVRVGDLEDKDKMLRTLRARLASSQEARQQHEKEWRKALLAWMQQLDGDEEDSWESTRYMPMVFQHVETALPNVTSAVFNRRRVFTCTADDPASIPSAEAAESLLDWQIRAQAGMEPAFDRAMWFATLFGTGYFDTQWSYKMETRLQPVVEIDTDDEGTMLLNEHGWPQKVKVMKEQETVVEDFPVVRAPHPMDIWPCPYSEVGDDVDWYFEWKITTIGRLRNASGEGHIDADAIDAWVAWRKDRGVNGTDDETGGIWQGANTRLWDQWMSEVGLGTHPVAFVDDHHDNDQQVVLCVYRSKSEIITMVEGDFIIGYSKAPYMHGKTGLVCHQFFPIPGSPWGRGLGTVLLGHQSLVNENINRYMDAASLSLMAPLIVNRNSVSLLDKDFVWEPNALIFARDVNNGAKRMELPAPTNLAMQIDAHLKKDADDTSGFGEQMRGLATPGVGTATEFKGLQQNIMNRAYMHVRRLQQTMSMVGALLNSLNQQFMTEAQVVKVIGVRGLDYVKVQPWELVGKIRVTCTADPNRASPDVNAQQLIGATQVILPLIAGQGGPAGIKLARKVLETLGVDDVEDLIPDTPGSPRDPLVENAALENGAKIMPHPGENFTQHAQTHSARREELAAKGAPPQVLNAFDEHLAATYELAAQAGAQQAQGGQQGPQPDAEQGLQPGQIEGQAQGAAGVPGQASPGPQFAPGRMMRQ